MLFSFVTLSRAWSGMRLPRGIVFLAVCSFGGPTLLAEASAQAPPLLAEAAVKWDADGQDLAFTQLMTVRGKDNDVKESRSARYDPSRSDRERWQLLELNGKPATAEEREKWETAKNRRPRNKGGLSPSSYLDLAHAKLIEETGEYARYEAPLLKEKSRLIASEQLSIVIQVDKKTGDITRVTALLREPMKIAFGLAKVTDLDLDLPVEAAKGDEGGGAVAPDASAKLTLTKFGEPTEFVWGDFSRVTAHPGTARVKE
ncbi:MAG: hypothetical protein H7067_11975 [Burkholderiales bacterium]|nr:hypothetical protein [Opitutaceae bacterium]